MIEMVSTIMAVYNAEKYVGRAIESVLNQTYSDIEFIIINDGSTDECGEIVSAYAKKDSRIKVINKQNGIKCPWQVGLESVSGQYIQFIDNDDEYKNTRTEKLLQAITNSEADAALCGFVNRRTAQGVIVSENSYSLNDGGIFSGVDVLKNTFSRNRLKEHFNVIVLWNKLFRADVIKQKGLSFSSGAYVMQHEDYPFIFKYLAASKTVACVNEPLYYYYFYSEDEHETVSNKKSFKLNKENFYYSVYENLKRELFPQVSTEEQNEIKGNFAERIVTLLQQYEKNELNLSDKELAQKILDIKSHPLVKDTMKFY